MMNYNFILILSILKNYFLKSNNMPKKVEQFANERTQVLNQMLQILGINEQNNMFSLHKKIK
jgi:hypothetical protein